MSSVSKGNDFENKVFTAIKNELANERLGFLPKSTRAFQKKSYYSKQRESNIIVDISIEIFLPESANWSMLWVCECKDYSGSVPVNDVEEFKSKLDQIAGANVKGVMAISGAMQSSALRYAKNNGIGVIRILPENQVQHVLFQMSINSINSPPRLNSEEFNSALINEKFIGLNREFYAINQGLLLDSWSSLLFNAFIDHVPSNP